MFHFFHIHPMFLPGIGIGSVLTLVIVALIRINQILENPPPDIGPEKTIPSNKFYERQIHAITIMLFDELVTDGKLPCGHNVRVEGVWNHHTYSCIPSYEEIAIGVPWALSEELCPAGQQALVKARGAVRAKLLALKARYPDSIGTDAICDPGHP